MQLNDIVALAFNRFGGNLRRDAILYLAAAFCAATAIVFMASATVLALEPYVGMVYARLILAGVFALALGGIVLATWLARRPTTAGTPLNLHGQAQTAQRSAQFAQLAMIVEAVLLGYSMARRR